MAQFKNFVSSKNEVKLILNKLKDIVEELISLGAELENEVDKIENSISNIDNDRVNIALIGSFSDGKTTVIAGMLKTVMDNMIIDTDESSKEIAVYNVKGFEDTCVVIDTPGLFGDKILGEPKQSKLYSELTKDYISRAHIILFVMDATNPLKNSHYETVKWIINDLNKMDETIFVINKMDEVANLTDIEEFREQEIIKKKVVNDRLLSIPNISNSIEENLNIVCISANPNGRGLDFWFNKEDAYVKRSRIDNLNLVVEEILKNTSMVKLINKTGVDVILDICEEVTKDLKSELKQYDEYIETTENEIERIRHEMYVAERKIKDSKSDFFTSLNNMQNRMLFKIKDISSEEILTFIDEEIGRNNDELGQKLRLKIEFESDKFFNQSSAILEHVSRSIESHIESSERLLNDIVSASLGKSGKIFKQISKIDEGKIKEGLFKARDIMEKVFKKKIKFKPWGATKWSKRIAKYSGPIGMGVEMLMDFINLSQKSKAERQLLEVKRDLTDFVNEYFGVVYDTIGDDEKFIEAYAPQLLEFKKIIENQQDILNGLQNKQHYLSAIDTKLIAMKNELQ